MRICSRCSREVSDESQFCTSCGADISNLTVPAQTVEPGTSSKAIASLIGGFFSLFPPAAILAIVLGHIARSEIRKSSGRLKGKGMALAGLILGYLGVLIVPLLVIAVITKTDSFHEGIIADEASAVGSLRTINMSAGAYAVTYGGGGFPQNLASLGPPSGNNPPNARAAALIDPVLASGLKSSYRFTYFQEQWDKKGFPSAYRVQADPIVERYKGQRHFFIDQTGIIRFEDGRPAGPYSPRLDSLN